MSLLAQELKIGDKIIRNRIAMPPMANGLATDEGEVIPKLNSHYEARARKGVGLIIVEHSYIHPSGKASPRQLAIDRDGLVEGLSTIAAAINGHGALSAIQITHAGSKTSPENCGQVPLAPSPVANPFGKSVPREFSTAELSELKEWYVKAALRAEKAGFGAVELHGAHGYLLNQFHSPLTNHRQDSYGGSDSGRVKFPLEVVAAVRKALDDHTILMYRLGADDLLPGGLTIEETGPFAVRLEQEGADLIDVSGGMSMFMIVDKQPGFFRTHSRAIKDMVSIPVMVTGGVKTPEFAEEILKSGDADIVGVGRGLLKNPKWARDALKELED
jgi:2,4-dienoyl-CoA reductase-like NADH-dependent reductase (Old Yellow Enzyme family)